MNRGTLNSWGSLLLRVALLALGVECRMFAAGAIIAWGDNRAAQTNIPPTATNLVAISAGGFHNLAVRADSTVVAWGQNSFGESTVPDGLSNVVAVAAGRGSSVALQVNGSVIAWGWNVVSETTFPADLRDVKGIAAGWEHALALKDDGNVVAWGSNAHGQTNLPPGLSNVVAIAGGGWHSLALRGDGMIVTWGDNGVGQCDQPPGLTNVIAIAGGGFHSLALRRDSTVAAWGTNDFGQIDVPPGLTNVAAIAAGQNHSLALKHDGTIVSWGQSLTPEGSIPAGLTNVGAISAGLSHTMALTGAKVKTLQMMVEQAQPGDTIVLEPTTYYDHLMIDKDLTLRGAGVGQSVLDSHFAGIGMTISSQATVVVQGITVTNASLLRRLRFSEFGEILTKEIQGPGVRNYGKLSMADCEIRRCPGGGLENFGAIEVERCTIAECGPGYYLDFWGMHQTLAGGIDNLGRGRVVSSILTNCETVGFGGGIRNVGVLAVTNCTVVGHAAPVEGSSAGDGGAIANYGQLTLDRCVVSGVARWTAECILSRSNLLVVDSTLSSGGTYSAGIVLADSGSTVLSGCLVAASGIENGGPIVWSNGTSTNHSLALTNCTVTGSENFPQSGIVLLGPTHLSHCTIVSNSVSIFVNGGGIAGNFTAENCIIAGNGNYDISGTVTSAGYNFIQNTNGMTLAGTPTGNLYGIDARVGPLQDNGGPTLTHAPRPGSPVLDAGSCGDLSTDQRGFPRPCDLPSRPNAHDGCDIGAVEFIAAPTIVSHPGGQTVGEGNPQSEVSTPIFLPPVLTATRREGQLMLSWPAGEEPFLLETTQDLTPPVDWWPVEGAPVTIDGNVTLPIQPTDTLRFYRLRPLP